MRITNQMTALTLLSDTQRIQQRLLVLQRQAATGHRINEPSDDPIGAVSALRLRALLARQGQFGANVAAGTTRLESTDAALSDLSQVYTDMKSLILEMSDESQTAESRQAAAFSVAAALDQVLGIANRQQEGKALFGGSKTNITPFVSQGGGIVYQGNADQIQLAISEGQRIAVNLTGAEVFGATTSEVAGYVDLNPVATTASKLADLNNGRGVAEGAVLLGDGVNTEAIDLSAAESLGDVVDLLNANTLGIVASITTTGGASGSSRITLTKAGFTLTVDEVAGNTTAADLGIKNTTGSLGTLNGTDLDPALTDLTALADLRNGTGIADLASGLLINNGSNSGTVSFTGLTTIQEVRNQLNASGLYVDARISSDGRKLDLVSTLNGAEFRVAENGGTTGALFGLLSLHGATTLSSLNRGQGVTTASLPGDDDFIITQRDGTTISVNLSAATSIQDVLDAINTDAENTGDLVASLNPSGGNGIRLVDASAGATALSVVRLNDSLAASGLGIEQTVSGGGGTLTGVDVNPIVTGSIFSILTELQTALNDDNTQAINLRGLELDAAFETLLDKRATAGGRLQRLDMTDARIQQETLLTQGTLSNVLDADLAQILTQLSQEQISLQAALQILATSSQLSLVDFL